MTDDAPKTSGNDGAGDRIAKVMARSGVASRREAERMILEGRVSVNGKVIDSPALDVRPSDRITVDGKKLEEPQETKLWLYYKPLGLVTSESDEKGRQTVFDALPRDLPRVMTVGRLDLNSEGLLLLTNDGELKRQLELPSTGWLRRYRVRVNGQPSDLTFAPLRRGATIEGEEFAPMEIRLDSQQGANAWLTVGIREGKNREIRRAMTHVGLQVNRLIRIGYGPFKLTGLEKNQVIEVKRRVLRDQLGGLLTGEATEKDREMRPHGAEPGQKPRQAASGRRPFAASDSRPGRGDRPVGAARRDDDRPQRARKPREDDAAPRAARGDKPARAPWKDKPAGRETGDDARAPREKKFGKPAFGRSRDGETGPDQKARSPRPEGGKNERPRSGTEGKRGSVPSKHDRSGDRPSGGKPFAGRSDSAGKGPAGARQDGSQKFRGKSGAAGSGSQGGARGRSGDTAGRGPSGKPRGPRPDGKGRGPRP